MNPNSVKPGDWDDITVILNDVSGGYSVVFGEFRGDYCLAMRWNGDGDTRGYPGQGPYPLWFVIPGPFNLAILSELLKMSSSNPNIDIEAIKIAKDTLI